MPIIYRATNIVNEKFYIGMTRRTLEKRRAAHLTSARNRTGRQTRFHAAVRKYGEAAFLWEVLETHATDESANAAEVRLIGALQPEYNIRAGGRAIGYPLPEETRQKIGNANRGRRHTAETRAKMVESQLKRWESEPDETRAALADRTRKTWLGRAHTEESRIKIGKSGLGRQVSAETREAIRKGNTGKIVSEETRRKLSASARSPERMAILATMQQSLRGKARPDMIERNRSRNHRLKVSLGRRKAAGYVSS